MKLAFWVKIPLLYCLLCSGALPVFAQSGGDAFALQQRLVELYNENHSAMVRVKAVYNPEEGKDVPQVVIGTGFFISREGLILTNASIVNNPVRVWVEHENIAYSTDFIGSDASSNIALLRVNRLPQSFNFLHLVDSPDLPSIGSVLVRISMPLEFNPSPQLGLVTGFESRIGDHFFPCLYVRTSIPAGPGDGGSAYFDLTGRLIGIQVGSLPEIGSSYVLPARAALRLRDDLLFSGSVQYGWIGFEVDEDVSIEEGRKIVLTEIFEDSPAQEAGLLVGDQVLQIGDYGVTSLDDLRNAMFYSRVGRLVEVTINREGKTVKTRVRLAERPEDEPLQVIRKSEEPPAPVDPIKTP